MVFETARLWADLGDYIPAQGGAFCINGVTGPDEYTALVNNNCYTNLMAQDNLRYAATLADELAADQPDAYAASPRQIGLRDEEVADWRRAASRMRVPCDVPRDPCPGRHVPDTGAAGISRRTPAVIYPLLLHFHPLVIYRHQVLKQPDVVLAQVLLGDVFTHGGEEAQLRLLRRAHDRRLVAVTLHPERRCGRAGLRGNGLRVLHAHRTHGPRRRERQRCARRPHRRHGRVLGHPGQRFRGSPRSRRGDWRSRRGSRPSGAACGSASVSARPFCR